MERQCEDFSDCSEEDQQAPESSQGLFSIPGRSQVQRITLRRHRDTGFGFRPAGCANMTIVASVRANSSAARHGLKMGDRIHSIITPTRHLTSQDAASMLVEFRNGPQVKIIKIILC